MIVLDKNNKGVEVHMYVEYKGHFGTRLFVTAVLSSEAQMHYTCMGLLNRGCPLFRGSVCTVLGTSVL